METYRLPELNLRPAMPVDLGYWADIRFDADDAAPNYVGLNLLTNTLDSDPNWKIFKFTYSGINTTRIQVAYGTWTARASLF